MNPGNNRTSRNPRGVPIKGSTGHNVANNNACSRTSSSNSIIPHLQVQPGTPIPEAYPTTRNTPLATSSHGTLGKVGEERSVVLPQIIPSNQMQGQNQMSYGVTRAAGVAMATNGVMVTQGSRHGTNQSSMSLAGQPVMSQGPALDKCIKQGNARQRIHTRSPTAN